MHDVHTPASLARQPDQQTNGLELGFIRPRRRGKTDNRAAFSAWIGLSVPRTTGSRRAPAAAADLGQTGMRLENIGRDVRKLIHTRGAEKALEAQDTRTARDSSSPSISRNDATPEAHVDGQAARRGARFCASMIRRGGRRNAVERHVNQSRDAAGHRGERRGVEPFPVSAAGIVHVNVRIDEAWHHHGTSGVDHGAGPAVAGLP